MLLRSGNRSTSSYTHTHAVLPSAACSFHALRGDATTDGVREFETNPADTPLSKRLGRTAFSGFKTPRRRFAVFSSSVAVDGLKAIVRCRRFEFAKLRGHFRYHETLRRTLLTILRGVRVLLLLLVRRDPRGQVLRERGCAREYHRF